MMPDHDPARPVPSRSIRRAAVGAALLAAVAFGTARAHAPTTAGPDAVVDWRHSGRDGALIEGRSTFRTLGAALAAAPTASPTPFTIAIRDGRYHEKLVVEKPNIRLVGESRAGTIITFDAAADTPNPDGGTWRTSGSATLTIRAPDFRAERLTIQNAFDYPANAARPPGDPAKMRNTQAVALMLAQGSDRAVFRDVAILGHQDTLFANAGSAYFSDCTVAGNVDFIFGAGRAVFDRCDIVTRDRGSATNNGYITAPSTPIASPYGFLFTDCRLLKDTPALAPGSVALGRPWHPSADPDAVGSAVFIRTWMDDHISAAGWEGMGSTDASGTRVWFRAEDARFFEYASSGPGALRSASRRVLRDAEAAEWTIERVLGGWRPDGYAPDR